VAANRLKEAWSQYEAGDLVSARRMVREILSGSPSEAERAEANELLSKTSPQLWAWPYVAGAAAILVAMLALAILRG